MTINSSVLVMQYCTASVIGCLVWQRVGHATHILPAHALYTMVRTGSAQGEEEFLRRSFYTLKCSSIHDIILCHGLI